MTLPDFSKLFVEGREIESEIGRVVLSVRPAVDSDAAALSIETELSSLEMDLQCQFSCWR